MPGHRYAPRHAQRYTHRKNVLTQQLAPADIANPIKRFAWALRSEQILARNRGYQLVIALLLVLAMLTLAQMYASAQSSDDEKLARGMRLYNENCAVCHGPNGEGRVGAQLAKNWPSIRPELTVKTIIENGVAGSPMPAWSQAKGGPLSAEDIDALVYYILSWQTGGFPQFTPPPTVTAHPPITPIPNVAGDPNLGAVLYGQNCAVCHGPNGEGRIGATLAKAWSGVRPDLLIKATIQNGVSGSPMPAWSQAKGGPLSDTDIDNLVAYILTLESSAVTQPQPSPTPAETASPFSGWGGVIFTIVLLVILIGAAILFQAHKA
jgi:mono/diheme cytochrome c family protein